uniref:Uncharacterized protein n=1 Tax=Schmidtea mediterranea TaxID=79327 RepID=I1ZIH1_SCHMD|nr:hypothetical protein [Schmidtea mediterranea]
MILLLFVSYIHSVSRKRINDPTIIRLKQNSALQFAFERVLASNKI